MYSIKIELMSNSWGGARAGSGQKPKWKSGDTKAVRIPEKILDDVLTYARLLDDGLEGSYLLSCDRPEALESVQKVEKLRKLVPLADPFGIATHNPLNNYINMMIWKKCYTI